MNPSDLTKKKPFRRGFSVLELLVAVAVLGLIVAIAVPNYHHYITRAEINKVIEQIEMLEILIKGYHASTGRYPDSLEELGVGMLDPWGNPYQYLRIEGSDGAKGHQRKDHALVPINSDFDLYSMGEDGKSAPPLTAHSSKDDIVRANNGGFIGLATDY